ncbi:MAG: carboxypeptidase-like regulatory domain-containing protein, partial [Acidobacteriota bacterium]|nr:carboxypeptidase-like regulatory domain-containing protein [Acidobacteriota bacterium]
MKEFDPNALRVAKPCGVEWDSMTGDEQKRRCDLCELDVYNIEEMTRRQVARLLSMPDGRICGRIRRRADGTIVTRNCPKGIRDYGFRMARIAGAALSAVLAMFSITYTQTDTSPSVQEKTTVTRRITGENGIKGSVSDQVGALIPGAGIKVRRKGTDFGIEFKTEPTGEFSLSDIEPGVYELEVSADGFETKSVRSLVVNKNEVVYLAIRLTSGPVEMMGDITVAIHTNLGVRILDQNGAVLPGAALSVQNRDLEAKRLFISDVQGEIATYLDPGVYDLTITMDGFETKRIRNFVIDSDKPVQINVELKVKQIRLFGPRILTGDEDIAGSIND